LEVHLDLVGGLAGDMFIAALLDAFPHCEPRVMQAIQAVEGPSRLSCTLIAHQDTVLRGRRFDVTPPPRPVRAPWAEGATHPHTSWQSIRGRLMASPLDAGTRDHAVALFELLAEAEGFVHGVDSNAVQFHEVGAWDSIADIVGAAALIHALGVTRWTCSPAPLGSGRVKTDHGMLPVPAPATTRLLMGMPTLDDGIGGERITPTGAAILRYLCAPDRTLRTSSAASVRTLIASGTGFGSRVLPGLSNHVRVLCFEPCDSAAGGHREIHVLEFEVDDQSGEDLATGLDRLRAHEAVLDVTQTPVFGKKSRMMAHVRVLAHQGHLDAVVEACFRETTTIGLRHHAVRGIGLKRKLEEVSVDGRRLRVKVVDRPGGPTAKTESDDVLSQQDHARRASLRARAESAALLEPVARAERAELDA
jgi:uncharacterized protein (TIGR00299 family) protein